MFTTKNVKSKLSSWMRNSARCERGRDVNTFELTTSLVTRSLFFLLWSVAFLDDMSSYINHINPRLTALATWRTVFCCWLAVSKSLLVNYWLLSFASAHLGSKPQACKYIYGSCSAHLHIHAINVTSYCLKKNLSFIAFAWTNMSVYHMT